MSPSTQQLKAIKVYGKGSPNPPKVAMIVKELGLPHEITAVPMTDVKGPDYVAINPNGRLPAIYDPNTDITLWESGAIVLYLIEKYDTEHKISFPRNTREAYLAQQWLFYQATGQGPYYGQAVWFKRYHHEQLPSAQDRYIKEAQRVTAVVEGHLTKQRETLGEAAIKASGGPWLVGNKCTYADLAWVSWQHILPMLVTKEDGLDLSKFTVVADWLNRMGEREGVQYGMATARHE